MTAAAEKRKRLLTAILLTCMAYFFFAICDAAIKMLTGRFHFIQIMTTCAAITVLTLSLYGAVSRNGRAFTTKKVGLMTLRALLAQGVVVCNLLALPHVHLSTFYALVFTSPFWVALLTAVFLKDRLTMTRAAVIFAGFGVVLFILDPAGGGGNLLYMGFALTGAFLYSCQIVIMRLIGKDESRVFMVLSGALTTLALMLPFLPAHFIVPHWWEMGVFALVTMMGIAGLFGISYAFQTAPSASAVAPYHYTQIVWGALFGWIVFHEVPEHRVLIGAGAIIAMGLYLAWSETRPSRIPDAETAALD